ncbi:MAG: SBBP repeat-containing protein, partial [Candidatus Cloacimonadaceae bacterium]
TSAGGWDIFTAKLDTDGNWLWAAGAGGNYNSGGLGISVDNFGNSYITGTYEATIMIGTESLSNSGNNDVFIAKLDTNGNWLWARRAGGTSNDISSGIIVDNFGNCYVSGYFNGAADFGATLLTTGGNYDVFAVKLDANGNWLWAVNAGGTGNDYANALVLDRNNCCIFLTGSFYNAAQFGTNFMTSSGESDIFVARLDSDGNWLWATRGGGASSEEGLGISTDGKGNCYVTGEFYNDIQFGVMTLTGNGNSDVYVVKLAGPTPKAPQNLVISAIGNDIRLTWNHVTEDKDGQPLTLDYYEIYYCQDHPDASYSSLGQTSDSLFVHSGAALSSPGFYYVKAVVAD